MNRMRLALLIGGSVAVASAPARAQAPVVIEVDDAAAVLVPADALRAALSAELRSQVVPGSPPTTDTPRGVLTLSLDEERRLVLVYRDAAGNEIHRTVTVPRSPAATLEMVVLIAGNLIRNEADDLVGSLIPPPPIIEPPPIVEPPAAAPPPPPSAPPVIASPPATLVKRSIANRALAHRLTLGVEGFGTANQRGYGYGGFTLAYTASAHIAAGVNNLTWAGVNGLNSVSAGPFVEAFWFPRRWLQPFGQVGVPLQVRWRGAAAGFGASVYAGTGVRFWIGQRMSLGAAVRLMVVASNAYLVWAEDLSKGTVSFAGGLEVAGHL
jgi:hypothetical protein